MYYCPYIPSQELFKKIREVVPDILAQEILNELPVGVRAEDVIAELIVEDIKQQQKYKPIDLATLRGLP